MTNLMRLMAARRQGGYWVLGCSTAFGTYSGDLGLWKSVFRVVIMYLGRVTNSIFFAWSDFTFVLMHVPRNLNW
jgi:hypothetical protein